MDLNPVGIQLSNKWLDKPQRNFLTQYAMKTLGISYGVFACLALFWAAQPLVAEVEFVSLHSFSVEGSNGILPRAGLTLANDGNLYGTTGGIRMNGGGRRIQPTVFKMSPTGVVTTLAWFDDPDNYPQGKVMRDEDLTSELLVGRDGDLFGVADRGGKLGYGRIFKMALDGNITTLHGFEGYYGTNGWGQTGGLIEGADGWFYGTASGGGIKERSDNVGMGTIYKVGTNGELKTLFYFKGTNGEFPVCRLTLGNDGCFYGTAPYGGPAYTNGPHEHGQGTIFKITTNGQFTTLFAFDGTNGARPYGGLTQCRDGSFYGTTTGGGKHGYGTAFRITSAGRFESLCSFTGKNGAHPRATLLLATDGFLYGTTQSGGESFDGKDGRGMGAVFQLSTNGTLKLLFSFNGRNGINPRCVLAEGKDGSLYGTTEYGGVSYGEHDNGAGTIFRIKMARSQINFSPQPAPPRNPQSP